jgi:hypothetical protein
MAAAGGKAPLRSAQAKRGAPPRHRRRSRSTSCRTGWNTSCTYAAATGGVIKSGRGVGVEHSSSEFGDVSGKWPVCMPQWRGAYACRVTPPDCGVPSTVLAARASRLRCTAYSRLSTRLHCSEGAFCFSILHRQQHTAIGWRQAARCRGSACRPYARPPRRRPSAPSRGTRTRPSNAAGCQRPDRRPAA